jgi:hypothetical protein
MYQITEDGKFTVENYNWMPSFSSFLPGIAGRHGIPMWVYYVSRGQCICSMGVRDKNHALMEFLSFNKALELVGLQGFRTFVKTGGRLVEPFRKTESGSVSQKLTVSSAELEIEESSSDLGLNVHVLYFPLVGAFFPGLVRRVTFQNTGSTRLSLEYLDGIAHVIPYGVDFNHLHTIARHIEGMMEVDLSEGAGLFRLKQTPADVERVGAIEGGNFYFSAGEASGGMNGGRYVVDPCLVFGECEIYDYPWSFKDRSVKDILGSRQVRQNRTPCAFTAGSMDLPPGERAAFFSVAGYASTNEQFRRIMKLASSGQFLAGKRTENVDLTESIKGYCLTASGDNRFDHYAQQTFLDNVIRGGMPVVFETAAGKTAFYVYSRQNGDLERDYHFFVIEPTYYSQGTGHYRSVNQNRRCDTWFFPQVEDRNIVLFMNLIQLDGYNPLEVNQLTYSIHDTQALRTWLRSLDMDPGKRERLKTYLSGAPFTPGEFIMKLEALGVKPDATYEETVARLLSLSRENDCGDVHEGYWIDHWHYNLDLIENYLMVYPERLKRLLLDNREYYFYDNPDVVLPRSEQFVLVPGRGVRRYGAVARDPAKKKMIEGRRIHPKRVRTRHGKGAVYTTSLLVKLLTIVANRMATLDPMGIGMEMEADKPGWNDSMNGLPGLVGSSLCETLELERALDFLVESCGRLAGERVRLFEELDDFIRRLEKAIRRRLASRGKTGRFAYWDESHAIKERYLERTRFGVSGREVAVSLAGLKPFLEGGLRLIRRMYEAENMADVFDPHFVPYTYYVNEASRFRFLRDRQGKRKTNRAGFELVKPTAFVHKPLPLFLEGAVHMLKVHREWRRKIFRGVRNSRLFDDKLQMYKVCEPLDGAPFEIGRVKAWGPGWIENASVYTHMEYKYLLEILKSGLHEAFFKDMRTMLMPFLKPEAYCRSPLENVSFIVSSAFPDETMHGRGLQPRLSGVTGEMIHIWILMMGGPHPFFLDENGGLCFKLEPVLPGWLFADSPREVVYVDGDGRKRREKVGKNEILCRFLGRCMLAYRNPGRKNTFGKQGAKAVRYRLVYGGGETKMIRGAVVPPPHAGHIRDARVDRIEVLLE